MTAAIRTTVVIVNWNGERFLHSLIRSLEPENPASVIVVDNASTDNSLPVLAQFSHIQVIRNDGNRGFGAAANQGIRLAETPYVLLLNADVEVHAGAVQSLESFLEDHPDASVVAPQLLFPDGRLQRSIRSFPEILQLFLYLSFLDRVIPSRYRMKESEHHEVREVEQPMGAALMFRKSVFDQIGGFDEAFFMYFEEVDLCERIVRGGGKIYFNPASRMIHHAGGSTGQDWTRSQKNYVDSVILYFRKRSPASKIVRLKLSLFAAFLVRSFILFAAGRWRQSVEYLKICFRMLQ